MIIQAQDIMSKHLFFISPDLTILEAAKTMGNNAVGSLLVKEDEKVVAIITEVDIVRKVVAKEKDPGVVTVKDVMVSPIITISPKKSISEANDLMDKKNIRHLGVEDDGKIVGIITSRDLQHPMFLEG